MKIKLVNKKITNLAPVDIDHIVRAMRQLAPSPYAYAIWLSVLTGMTDGEIAALRWDNIEDNCIHICREQRIIEDAYGSAYADLSYSDDNYCNRRVPLTDDIRGLLDEIRTQAFSKEYVFPDDGSFTVEGYTRCLGLLMTSLGYDIKNNDPFRMALDQYVLIPKGYSAEERTRLLGGDADTSGRFPADQRIVVSEQDGKKTIEYSPYFDNNSLVLEIPLV